ncbi:MAG: hypothetical protein HC812_06825 [Leptolyngbya sp. RL_3_1]|nr:hypothetical protein [Leptolyngbya sp. RL_3_1]
MGLIKNVVGAISGLVGTLFSAILGIFGLGKKSEYFLEFDEAAAAPAPKSAPATPAAAPAEAKPAKASAKAEKVAPAPVAVAAAPQSQASKPASPAEGGLTFATDFLVNPRLSNTSRRRPGPSLSPFTDMVKEMKRSNSMG